MIVAQVHLKHMQPMHTRTRKHEPQTFQLSIDVTTHSGRLSHFGLSPPMNLVFMRTSG